VNSLSKTVTRQRRGCDLNPGLTAPESSALTTWLPSHPFNKSSKNFDERPHCTGRPSPPKIASSPGDRGPT